MLRPEMVDELQLAREREPLGLWVRARADYAPLRAHELEYASRGDRVTGQLILPSRGEGPFPLALVQHALGDSAAGVLGALGTSWVRAGAAVAAVDFPLHGARADQKLLHMLVGARDARYSALAAEFTQQAVLDLERALDALAAAAPIDAKRIAYVGFGLGAQVGSAFCALDPRPAAAALGPGVGGALTSGPDPAKYLDRIAPRPLLRVEKPPRAAAAAIFAFLARHLGL